MADILKVTSPLVNKYQLVEPKRNVDIPQFNMQDTTKVKQTMPETGLLKQNNNALQDSQTSAMLLDMLKDPSVTVGYLRNISMLQEAVRLMPANNKALTQEIEQLFDALMLAPEDLLPEMLAQEGNATWFHGEVFDLLRGMLDANPGSRQVYQAVVDMLKALNLHCSQEDILDALANNLAFLADAMDPSRGLAERLRELAAKFRGGSARDQFEQLKEQAMELFRDVEESILYNPKMEKTLSIAIYNLSRYNSGTEGLQAALDRLLAQMGSEARQQMLAATEAFLRDGQMMTRPRVLDALVQILNRQMSSEEMMAQNADKMNKIIQSLLSSPCNYTPLLHFVLPLQYENIQSFMEFWVNPNGEEDEYWNMTEGEKKIHMLMVFDIGSLGRFELELFVKDRSMDVSLFCPKAHTRAFEAAAEDIRRSIRGLDFQVGQMRVENLERPRSLMEVFRSLPFKRTGVDVKV